MRKRILFIFGVLWVIGLAYFVHYSLALPLPSKENEILFYFREHGSDLKYLLARFLQSARTSVFLSSFGITDAEIAAIVAAKQIPITVAFDAKERNLLPTGDHVHLLPYTKRGLMHRKVVAIDDEFVLLGSTNLTPMALKIHHNLITCIRSKSLYQAIVQSTFLQTPDYSYYPLPEKSKNALHALLEQISHAKRRIFVCMYTFTHPLIIDALLTAKSSGVDVRLYLDRGMAKGTCKKATARLSEHLPIKTQVDGGLLHHKCALIDNLFIFGSANWTKAAFGKNEEYLLILPHPPLDVLERFFTYLDKSCN